MFKTQSMTQTANLASLLVVLAGLLDIDLPMTDAEAIIYVALLIGTIVTSIIGRFRVGDISLLGRRK